MFSSINIYLYEHISAHNIPQMPQQGGANDYSCISHAQSRAGRGLRESGQGVSPRSPTHGCHFGSMLSGVCFSLTAEGS